MKIKFTFLILFTCMLAIAGSFVAHRSAVTQKKLTRRLDRFDDHTSRQHKQHNTTPRSSDAPKPQDEPGPDDDILPMPETPETQQFIPTSIKDFKIANPADGISLIDAPKANSQGNASLTFDMILPQGRQGLEPTLPIQYSSDNGGSWLGTGWNLSLPAVTIDTRWGVPRYDTALETEMYELNGQQLAPTNNRSALIPRTAEKRFHLRVEGDFNKIIRHGDKPGNYWWEVTEKNGNRSYYGGVPGIGVVPTAVLQDASGNVAYWALIETVDLNGNFVHYLYTNVSDPGTPGSAIPGQQLYPSQIFYTGFGGVDGPYKIEFIRDRQMNEPKRKDVTIDCRLGLKTVSADLLREVKISFNGKPIRSYTLQYSEGAFYKQLLQSISELDSAGNVFYTHRFDYFDDVNKQNYTPADSIVSWNVPGDNIYGDNPVSISQFTSEASAINSSKAKGGGFSIGVTVGSTVGGEWSKKVSVGGFFNWYKDDQQGMTALVDINGDGLPDKVFKKDGALYYRPNLGGASKSFGDSRPITGVTDISASTSTTIGGGAQVIPYRLYVGFEHDVTNTTTTVYFADFNGDGLIDLANNGEVYFNHLNAQGDPEFTTSSTPTPNPILSGTVDSSFLVKDTALQTQQENTFPLQDVVKMWEAPYDGTVTITAPVQLIQDPNDIGPASAKNDGVRVSIQQGGTVRWNTTIGPTDYSTKTPTGVTGISVAKGQHIYFRLQSVYNGQDDQVSWDPVIDYTTPTPPTSDHKSSTHYQASTDFILHSTAAVGMSKAGSVTVDGTFNKALTTDTVSLQIVLLRNSTSTVVFQHDYMPAELAAGPLVIPTPVAVDTSDQLFFLIRSRSYIDRSALQWQPHYAYTAITDGTPVTGTDGKPTLEGYPVPDNSNYNIRVIAVAPYVPTTQSPITIWPKITGGGLSGTLWLTIKGNDTIYARRQITVNGGMMSTAMDSIRFTRQANQPLYIEYATDTQAFAQSLAAPSITVFRDSTVITGGTPTDTLIVDTVVMANLYTNPDAAYLGPMFRGWGQFALKGNQANLPIAEDSLNLNQVSSYPSNPDNYQDSASLGGLQNPTNTYFVTLYPDDQKQQWSGYDTSVFVKAGELSSSRVGMHDVAVDSTTAGGTAGSINKQIKTVNDSYLGGAFAGPVGASGGSSSSTATTSLDMMDINGDGYPDIVNNSSVQYTLPGGQLDTKVIQQSIGTTTDIGLAAGGTLGFDPIKGNPFNNTKRDAGASEGTAEHSVGLSGGIESNQNQSVVSWMDVNGDGLLDRLTDSGKVQLNLGYTFGPPEVWGLDGIDAATSLSYGAGLGVNIDDGSFAGGYGISRTTATNTFGLIDVNGDGLPDQLYQGNPIMVRLNTGNSFGPKIPWTSFDQVTVNSSTGEALNVAVTGVIPIPIIFLKICINPAGNGGWGTARTNDAVLDVDGDGYADMLHSGTDGDLKASVSAIGRTNLLRSIKGPLGSLTTLDYYRAGNTYGMPQSKWVLKSTTVFDGVKGDGVDTIRHQFTYGGGYQNRREREFYGFDTVITRDLNTANQNKVYRSHIQLFFNNSYYNRGLLASEWLVDSAGNKYTQTNYQYDLRPVEDSVQFPALTQTQKLYFEGAAASGVSTVIQYDYDTLGNTTKINDAGDGSQQDQLLTTVSYYHLDHDTVYVTSVPSAIQVTAAAELKRKRTTTIDPTGDVISMSQWLTNDSIATTDITYDNYGNVATITQPANYNKQRMSYTYAYDSVVDTYNTKVTDAFGYTTTKTYDYRFGILTGMINRNNEQTRYTVDDHGRITTFTAPFEMAAGLPYTIAMSYYPDSTISYAETRHYDPEYKSDIRLVNFVDGLDRSIQVKKQVALFKGKNQPDDVEMAVSGTALYDAFGRETTTYYPTPEAIGTNTDVYSTAAGNIESTTSYDVLDRAVKTVLADGASSTRSYSTTNGMFLITGADALGLKVETQFDVRARKRLTKEYGSAGAITTTFGYDALSELTSATDNGGNTFLATYDNFGRKVSAQHPDGGLTTIQYDLAGNVLRKTTAEIHKEMPDSGAIRYQYDYNRLTDVDYPRNYQNKVKYTYGDPGTGSKAGRVTLLEDGSGGEQFFYGLQGAVNKIIRTILISPVFATTFVSQENYDTWGRIKTLTYPDGEVVTYHYNKAGGLLSMDGIKQGSVYNYVEQSGYDLFEQRTYLRYGNGTENTYSYDSLRRRLVQMQALDSTGKSILNNTYTYDAEDNVLGVNGATVQQTYEYDNLYRLDSASGEYKGSSATSAYGVKLAYDDLYNIVHKTMHGAVNGQSYDNAYTYGKTLPHQAIQVGSNKFTYDANGNQLGYGDIENYYDEENRLMANIDKGVLSQYTYDAEGDMVIRSNGGLQSLWVNGAPAGTVKHTDNYSAYVSPYLVSRINTFTKNYYIDNQRIATKLGHGTFVNISFPQTGLSAGNVDYIARAAAMTQAQAAYYAAQGVSPGPPTDKNYYAEPQNSGIPAPVFVDSTANTAPPGWPADTIAPPNGAPVYLPSIPSNDSVKAGYGFQDAGQLYENDIYFFHYDLTGSTTYVTNLEGAVVQHAEYSPLGETFVEEHTGSFVTPYLFHAKEKDAVTDYYAYGARFYDPKLTQWLTVQDPMGADLPLDISGYGLLWDTDDDDNGTTSSPYMNPGLAVEDVMDPYDNVRTGRGKTADPRDMKDQARNSRLPFIRKWQVRFARWFPNYHEMPPDEPEGFRQESVSMSDFLRDMRRNGRTSSVDVYDRQSFSDVDIDLRESFSSAGGLDRESLGSIESIHRESSSSFAAPHVSRYAGRNSLSSVFNLSRRNLRSISSMRRRSSSGSESSVVHLHPFRPRSGSVSQGGNGSK